MIFAFADVIFSSKIWQFSTIYISLVSPRIEPRSVEKKCVCYILNTMAVVESLA